MNNIIDNKISATINNIRFPLIVMVVMLHTFIINESMLGHIYVPEGKYPHFDLTVYILKACIGEVSIPLFFLISVFLFFVNVEFFNVGCYKNKIIKRMSTLLMPYLYWNTFFIFFIFILQLIYPDCMGEKKMIIDFTFHDWIDAYWELSNGLIPLWYVRDLMIISLLSPIIFFLIKKTGFALPVILGILYFSNELKYVPGLGTRCSFLFTLGAYFGIKKINFFILFKRKIFLITAFYVLSIIIDASLWRKGLVFPIVNQITLFLGVVSISSIFYILTDAFKLRLPKLWVEASFFVLVFHMFVIYIPAKFWPLFIPVNIVTVYLMQIFIPIFISFVCVSVYWCCKRYLPRLTSIIVGHRFN